MSKDRLARLSSGLKEEVYDPNEVIYRTGDACDGLYVVTAGGVLLRNETPGQPVDRVLDVALGEVFGEMEVMEGAPRRLTARALGSAAVVWLPLESLRELMREHSIIETVLRTLSVRRQTSRARALLAPSNRREPRIWVNRDVVVQMDRGQSHRVRLVDLSNSGACISGAPSEWRADAPVIFSLGIGSRTDLLQVRGFVRWRRESTVGLSFDAPGSGHRRRVEQVLRELTAL
ncbi:MAG TPA: cyclic nucleotide-binding domain-containing protein [Thermoanaerobaculia bacterium]|nr:cyclic nucleotide-binding domain-containing protein [Thermoanaerobaculia bacterium]